MSYNSIIVNAGSDAKLVEAIGASVISPGDLLEYTSAGTVQRYSGATDYNVPLMIAVENLPEGKEISDDYAISDRVYFKHFRPGDVFQVRYSPVGSVAIGGGAGSLVGGGGSLGVAASIDVALCYCLETDGGGSAGRLIVVFAK